MQVPPIEEGFLEGEFDTRSVTERYYERKYILESNVQVLLHSNHVAIIKLAPSHPIVLEDLNIISVNFKINEKLDRSNNKVSGKGKRNAQLLDQNSILCHIKCDGIDEPFVIRAGLVAKLLEVNDVELETNPNVLKSASSSSGYICIVLPRLSDFDHQMSKLTNEKDYATFLNPTPSQENDGVEIMDLEQSNYEISEFSLV